MQHSYCISLAITSSADPRTSETLLSMDTSSGVTINTSGHVVNNLSVDGNLVVGATSVLATLNNKQDTLDSSSIITIDRITANLYFSGVNSDHTFVDSIARSRLLLGSAGNTFYMDVLCLV